MFSKALFNKKLMPQVPKLFSNCMMLAWILDILPNSLAFASGTPHLSMSCLYLWGFSLRSLMQVDSSNLCVTSLLLKYVRVIKVGSYKDEGDRNTVLVNLPDLTKILMSLREYYYEMYLDFVIAYRISLLFF